jgi:hypothetical protein
MYVWVILIFNVAAAIMKNTGSLFANDANEERVKAIVGNFHRLGIINSVITCVDGRKFPSVSILLLLLLSFPLKFLESGSFINLYWNLLCPLEENAGINIKSQLSSSWLAMLLLFPADVKK